MVCKRLAQAGMTLIELLIAVAIGAIVLAALSSVVSLGLKAQAAGRQANELLFQARFALQRMVTTARSTSPKVLATPTDGTTGDWFAPVMYCCKGGCDGSGSGSDLIETTTTDSGCTGTTGTPVIASNVTFFFAQSAGCVGATCLMFCRNASNQLIKTTTTDTACTGTTVIAPKVTWYFAPLPSSVGPVDKPLGVLFLLLRNSTADQTVWLTTSVRLGGGTL